VVAARENGTNLFRLNKLSDLCSWGRVDQWTSIKRGMEWSRAFLDTNKWYFYFDTEGNCKQVGKEEAYEFIMKSYQEAKSIVEYLDKIKLLSMSYELFHRISKDRRWKSRLKEEWGNPGQSDDLIQRLRNNFGHLIDTAGIVQNDDAEEIYAKLSLVYVHDRECA